MMHKREENRRWTAYRKAKRKEEILKAKGIENYYKFFGQFRKGKIHASRDRKDKVNCRLGGDWNIADKKRVLSCLDAMQEVA